MIFNKLTIQGFKSVGKPLTINFNTYGTGTCFVTGENLAEPGLGANGVGKSTIWDALCWCFYGKDTRGHRASGIINWYSKEKCIVKVVVNLDGRLYEIIRAQKPNQLLVDNGEVTQEELDKLFGLNYQSFLHLIVIPQFSSKFFDLQPADKLRIFSDILELDKWLEYSGKAKDKSDELASNMVNTTFDINYLEGQIKQLESECLSLTSRGVGWIAQQQEKINNLKRDIDENRSSRNIWKDQLDVVGVELDPLEEELTNIFEKREKLEVGVQKADLDCSTAERHRNSTQFSLKELDKDYKAFEGLEGICPHCDQQITKQYLESKLKDIQSKKDRAGKLLEKRIIKYKDAMKVRADIRSKIYTVDSKIRELNSDISALDKLQNELVGKLAGADKVLEMLEIDIDILENEENPFVVMKQEAQDQIKLYKRDRRAKKREIKELNKQHEDYKYWVKGFKEIRLFVIEEALLELELQINNNLEKLGLHGWGINLAVDYETKSGSIRKGFTVLIKSPKNEDLVPFTSFSGGEGQRLKIAGTLGLADFISSRTGINPNIEIWDEATSWMSNEGVKDLVELLFERAEDLSKTVFVVDHRDLNTFGEFTDTLHIIKDEEGSRII
jgi:DNA repair exonuclease SbcCD ATPase subunit